MRNLAVAPRARSRQFVPASLLVAMVVVGAVGISARVGFATTPTARQPSVAIKDFSFKPATLHVRAGAKISVTNRDGTTHTFTADKGAFDAGKIAPGVKASVTVKKAGTYAYHCEIHDYMKGTIKVT